MHILFELGLFSNASVREAIFVGILASMLSASIGIFTVLRGQAFVGHSITDMATAGGSGGFLLGAKTLYGFLFGAASGGVAVESLERENKNSDLSTGLVLGSFTGLSALFLYLESTSSASSSVSQQILFGSIFSFDASLTIPLIILTGISLFLIFFTFNQLLISSISSELSAARGLRNGFMRYFFILLLACAVSLSSLVVGSILSTALLIGPAGIAMRLTSSIKRAAILAIVIGIFATTIGIIFAFDSYYWSNSGRGLPVSFFIVAILMLLYILSLPLSRFQLHRSALRGKS